MALAAKKTASKKAVSGQQRPAKEATVVASLKRQVDAEAKKLAAAKSKMKQAKANTVKKKSKATQEALEKARNSVNDIAAALAQLKVRAQVAKVDARIKSIAERVSVAESRAKAKAEQKARSLTAKTEADFKLARKKFEDSWRKRRLAANAKKVRALEKKLSMKVKALDKKSRIQAKALAKKANRNTLGSAGAATSKLTSTMGHASAAANAGRAKPARRAKTQLAPPTGDTGVAK